jgi:uncharacterized protein YjbI with pentapeptide repeats
MKSRWKQYLLYASLIIVGGCLLFILVETVRVKNTGFETRTLWDWMELLIIPLVLAVGAYVLNRSEKNIERQSLEARSSLEREIATYRQQEAVLQAYLDRMAELLLKEKLLTSSNEEVRDMARIWTLTALRGLDGKRKGVVIKFLHEARLIYKKDSVVNLVGADLSYVDLIAVNLSNANLSNTNLADSYLNGADLNGTNLHGADLSRANLSNANMSGADLRKTSINNANLRGLDLSNANLCGVDLSGANLSGVTLRHADLNDTNLSFADLSESDLHAADLSYADLSGANLYRADLSGADLHGANLYRAEVADEFLFAAKSLVGATMPNGKINE